jgi:hypothetical protein
MKILTLLLLNCTVLYILIVIFVDLQKSHGNTIGHPPPFCEREHLL